MSNRHLVIVQSPGCFLHSATSFVIGEFLLTGWLKGASTNGPRFKLAGDVTAEDAAQLAGALGRMETTPEDRLHDALCGDTGDGLEAFRTFLRSGGFRLVHGETVKPEDLC